MKDLSTFYTELKAAGALTAEFASAANNGTVAEFLKAHEVDATAEEFMALAGGELTDTQLETVAGGANFTEAVLSIITLGIGCLTAAIESSNGTGTGNGKDGTLLCNDDSWHEAVGSLFGI